MQTNTPETGSKPNGRPPYEPTDEHRERVRILGRHGVPQVEIAASLGISAPTLRKHYRRDLRIASAEANEQVLDALFHLASNRRCASATIFWAKTRCQFSQAGPKNDS